MIGREADSTAPTQQYSSRNGVDVDHIVLHHAASTSLSAVLTMMNGGKEVSANYVVKDDRAVSVVPERYRSWSLASQPWDARSVTFEICNESAGGSWPVSKESHETVAQLVANIADRHSIPLNRDRILGHREVYSRHGASYATACPGGLDLDWIVQRAKDITNPPPEPPKSGAPLNTTMIISYTDTATGKPTWARKRGLVIQRTTDNVEAARWRLEIGLGHLDSISANALKYLERWAQEIAVDKAELAKLFTGATLDRAALAAEIVASLDLPSVQEIAEAVADEQAERLAD